MSYTGDWSTVSNSSTESSSNPTKWMSAGMGDKPVDSNTLMALRFTSSSVVSLEEAAVEQVSSVAVVTDCDACFGQQECVCCVCFTPGPDENPLLWDIHYRNRQYDHNLRLQRLGLD